MYIKGQKNTILIVEDETLVALNLESRLENMGYTVLSTVSSGESAILSVESRQPDLILMDIRIRGNLDGIQTADIIHSKFDIPIIYLTAYADKETLERAKVTEPYAYLIKPFDIKELHSAIEIALYKHRMEKHLREREQWLTTTLRSIGDGVITTDSHNLVTYINPVAEALIGWTPEEALGRDLLEVFRLSCKRNCQLSDGTVENSENIESFFQCRSEAILVCRDGREIPLDVTANPIQDEAGVMGGTVVVIRDITERKRSELALQELNESLEIKVRKRTLQLQETVEKLEVEIAERQRTEIALRENQEQLQAILDNSTTIIYLTDLEGRYLLINQEYEKVVGVSREQLIGKRCYDSWPREVAEAFAQNTRQVIARGIAMEFEEVVPQRDGCHTYISIKFPLRDSHGAIYAVCGISTDITERKRTEEALQQSEARFQKLAVNVPGMIYQYSHLSNGSQVFKYVSPSAREIWELEPEVFLQNSELIFSLVHPDDRQSIYESTVTSATTLQPWCWEGRIVLKSGKLKWIQGISRPEQQANGDIVWDGLIIDISDRKQAEEALRNSEFCLEMALSAAQMGTWDWNMETDRVTWSEKTESIFGLPPNSFLGTQEAFINCIHPEDRQELWQIIETSIKNQTPHVAETRSLWPDGTVRWVTCIGNIFCDREGRPVRMAGMVTDITERKLAEFALTESESRLRMALNAAQMGTWSWEIESGKITWSEQTESMFGYPPGSFSGSYEAFLNRVHPDDRGSLQAIIERTLADKTPYHIEHRILWPDGSVHWMAGKGDAIYNRMGQPVRMSGIVMDITDRKEAEAALRDSEFKLRTIVENSSDSIFLKDRDGRYLFINPAGAQFLGHPVAEIIGKRDLDLFSPETSQLIGESDRGIMQAGKPQTFEEIGECQGVRRIFLSTKCPYLSPQGELMGLIGVCRDITEQKEAEEALRRQLMAVEAATDGIAITNAQGEYIYLNEAHVKIFGYTKADELLGKQWNHLYWAEEAERIQQEVFPQLRCQGKWHGEVTAKRSNGTTFIEELSLTVIPNGGLICVCRDISERKQVEENLRIRERAIAASSNGILICDARQPDMPIVYCNPAFESMTGYSATEVLGQNSRFLQGPDRYQPGLAIVRTAIQEGNACTAILRNYRKDGSLFWNELTISPIYDGKGILTHYIGIQTDITESKQAETALQAAKDQLQAVIDAVPGLICWIDSNLQYLGVNQHLARILNVPPADLVGQDIRSFADFNSEFAEFMRRFFASDNQADSTVVEARINDLVGDYLIVTQKYQQGKAAVSVAIDITERKRAESQLRSSLKEKEVLLKEIHHRVKNNLQVISSLLKLQSGYIKDEKSLSVFIDSYNRVRSMALIHEKLYQSEGLSRLDAAEYIRNLVDNLFRSYTVSSCSIDAQVEVDSIQLDIDTAIPCGLIINELVSNSLKYGFAGRQSGKIRIGLHQTKAKRLQLSIQDNGIGLPADFKVEESDSLGLQLVYNLTEQLDGEIEVDSSQGTAFKMTFTQGVRG